MTDTKEGTQSSLPIEDVRGVFSLGRPSSARDDVRRVVELAQRQSLVEVQCVKVSRRDTPRMVDSAIPSRQRQHLKMRRPTKTAVIADQPLSSPNRAVRTGSLTVQGDANHGTSVHGASIVRQTRGNMGFMVLNAPRHREPMLTGERYGKVGTHIVRVQIADHTLRLYPEQVLVSCQSGLVVIQCLEILQAADVLADECIVISGKRECVL